MGLFSYSPCNPRIILRYAESLENPLNCCIGAGSSQTPTSCHSRSRRQAACPDPQPTFGQLSPAAAVVEPGQDPFERCPAIDAESPTRTARHRTRRNQRLDQLTEPILDPLLLLAVRHDR
jgi:hypothetical protein